MGIEEKTLEAILHPHKTERDTMAWIIYIFETGGGIVWIMAYWSLFLFPMSILVNTYTPQSIFAWAIIGLLLTVATLYKRFKVDPKREKELREYVVNFQKDFTEITINFNDSVNVFKNLSEHNPNFRSYYDTCTTLLKQFDDFKKKYE